MATLTDLVKRTFQQDILKEQDIAGYEHYVFVPAATDLKNLDSILIEASNSSSDIVSNLNDSYLLIKWYFQFIDVDPVIPAGAYEDDEAAAVLPRGAWSIFKTARLELGGEIIEQCNNPGHVFNIKKKVSKPLDWQISMNHDMKYSLIADGLYSNNTLEPEIYKWGKELIKNSAGATPPGIWSILRLKDVFGFANCHKLLPPCKLSLRLDLEKTYAEYILRAEPASVDYDKDLKVVIDTCKWYIPGLKLKDRLANEFFSKSVIEKSPIPYDWLSFGYSRLKYTPTDGNLHQVTLFSTVRKLRHLFIALQPQSFTREQMLDNEIVSNKASYRLGPMDTHVTEFFISVSGKILPFMRFQGKGEGYQREVEVLRMAYAKHQKDNSFDINATNFPTDNLIYYFDLSKTDAITEENATDVAVLINIRTDSDVELDVHCVYFSEVNMALQIMDGVARMRSVQN